MKRIIKIIVFMSSLNSLYSMNLAEKIKNMHDKSEEFKKAAENLSKDNPQNEQDKNSVLTQQQVIMEDQDRRLEKLAEEYKTLNNKTKNLLKDIQQRQQSPNLQNEINNLHNHQNAFEKYNDTKKSVYDAKNLSPWLHGIIGSFFIGSACYLINNAWGTSDPYYKYPLYMAATGVTTLASAHTIKALDTKKQYAKCEMATDIIGGFLVGASFGYITGNIIVEKFDPLKPIL